MSILRNEKGVAMPLVLVVLVVLALLGVALYYYSTGELTHSVRDEKKARAYYLARAGAESVAHYIMERPGTLDLLIPNVNDTASADSIPFETEEHGNVGEIEVELERESLYSVIITGFGTVDGIRQSVSILMEAIAPFDGVIYSDTSLNFQQQVNVTGDIVTAGEILWQNQELEEDEEGNLIHDNVDGVFKPDTEINFPPPDFPPEPENGYAGVITVDGSNSTYTISKNENNPPEDQGYNEVFIDLDGKLIVDASHGDVIVQTQEFDMQGGGQGQGTEPSELELHTSKGNKLQLVANEITLRKVSVTGNGIAEIFVREPGPINVRNPSAQVLDAGAMLVVYLDQGVTMDFQAHGQNSGFFQGLVYGPEAFVEMGGSVFFEGSMIVDQLKGSGQGSGQNPPTIVADEIYRDYDWGILEDIFGRYRIIQWAE